MGLPRQGVERIVASAPRSLRFRMGVLFGVCAPNNLIHSNAVVNSTAARTVPLAAIAFYAISCSLKGVLAS